MQQLWIHHNFLKPWVNLRSLCRSQWSVFGKERDLVGDRPLPFPSSAASIKLDIEGNENRAPFESSIGGDGGL
jgi:hypothetical protein